MWTAKASNGAKLSGEEYLSALRAVMPQAPENFSWMSEELYLIRDSFVENRKRLNTERPELSHAVGKWTEFLRACDQNGWDVTGAALGRDAPNADECAAIYQRGEEWRPPKQS